MSETTYVILDANILLHFHPPDQIDWPALCGSGEAVLVIYPLLRTELSNAKDMHPSKVLRRRAGAPASGRRGCEKGSAVRRSRSGPG